MKHCIPIQLNPAEACSATTGVDSVTWGDLISLVEGNQTNLIPACIAHIRRNVTEWKDQIFVRKLPFTCCKRNHLLDVFSKSVFPRKRFEMLIKPPSITILPGGDSMLTQPHQLLPHALLQLHANRPFRDIGDLDETYCKEKEVLYDEYKLLSHP